MNNPMMSVNAGLSNPDPFAELMNKPVETSAFVLNSDGATISKYWDKSFLCGENSIALYNSIARKSGSDAALRDDASIIMLII